MKISYDTISAFGLIVCIFLPSLIFVLGFSSSMSGGILVVSLLILLLTLCNVNYALKSFWIINLILKIVILLVSLLGAHFIIASFFVAKIQDVERFIVSITIVIVVTAAILIFGSIISRLDQNKFHQSVDCTLLLMLTSAATLLFGLDAFSTGAAKPSLLFSEPSHLSATLAPFLIFKVVSKSGWWKVILCFTIVWSIVIQNLTGLVLSLLVIFIAVNFKSALILVSSILLAIILATDFNYFLSRITLSIDNTNATALVFMQGWENAFLAMQQTLGLGVGFQQFGIANETGVLTERLGVLLDTSVNLFDGGSTAAKLVGEFGILGAMFVIWLTARAMRAAYGVVKKGSNSYWTNLKMSADLALMIEIWVRGFGYFTPGIFFYLCIQASYYCKFHQISLELNSIIRSENK